jgi:hypothetical protein
LATATNRPGFQQAGLRLANLRRSDVLRRSGHRHRVLIADLASGERLLGTRQLLELAGGLDALRGRSAREFPIDAQPGDHPEEAVGLVAPGLLEPAGGLGGDRLGPVDDLAALDDDRPELTGRLIRHPGRQIPQPRQDSLEWGLARPAHAAIVRHACDSCLS